MRPSRRPGPDFDLLIPGAGFSGAKVESRPHPVFRVGAGLCDKFGERLSCARRKSMIRSNWVKSACVAIALVGFGAPQAGAIELQGSNPTAQLSEGMISKAYIAHRGATAV